MAHRNGRRSPQARSRGPSKEGTERVTATAGRAAETVKEGAGRAAETAKETAKGTVSAAQETAERVVETGKGVVGEDTGRDLCDPKPLLASL